MDVRRVQIGGIPKEPRVTIGSSGSSTSTRDRAPALRPLLLCVLGILLLACAACSGVSPTPSPSTNPQAATTTQASSSGVGATTASVATGITGTVSWPDGTPATNVPIIIYPNGFDNQGGGDTVRTDSAGSYQYSGCPCNSLVAFLELPHNDVSNDPFNGGRDCWILMSSEQGFTGTAASNGDQVPWRMLDIPCDDVFYDPSNEADVAAELRQTEQQMATSPDPSSVDAGGYAGPWQGAQARAGD